MDWRDVVGWILFILAVIVSVLVIANELGYI